MNLPSGRILPVVNNTVASNGSAEKDKRDFYPINVESFPTEHQEAYNEYRQIVEMLKASRAKLDALFLPDITRLVSVPAGHEVNLALNFGLFQFTIDPIKKRAKPAQQGLVFKPAK